MKENGSGRRNHERTARCGPGALVVEVAALPDGGHAVRDSKDIHGPVLRFTADQWSSFVHRTKTTRSAN
jgi:Domain of unknown function (DUF397)